MLQRFQLLVYPNSLKTWKNVDRLPNIMAKEEARRIFQKFDAFVPFEPEQEGAFATHALRFSPEAQQIFDNWRYQLEYKLREGSLSPSLESHLAKFRSLIPKLALIFCLIDTPESSFPAPAVDAIALLRSIRWGEYLESHARRLYAAAEAPGMDAARALLKRIHDGDLADEFSIRSVYHKRHWSQLDSQDKVVEGVKILEEFGWVRREILKTKDHDKGGRPSTIVRLHPALRNSR